LKEDKVLVFDILDATNRIRKYIRGVSFAKFNAASEKQDAVVRNLGIIGEAAGKLSLEFKRKHSVIPWRDIVDMRNKLIHDYSGVDLDIVWDVCSRELPLLRAALTTAVKNKF